MMKKARMSLKPASRDVRGCLECIRGEPADGIHIRHPPSKSASVMGAKPGEGEDGAGGKKEGWKGLYRKG
jgi:hypothetical protein